MARWWAGLLFGAVACAPSRPPVPARATAAKKRRDAHRVVYCSATRTTWDVDHCIRELSSAQRRQRDESYRLDFDGKRLRTFTTVNGFGEPLSDDNGCSRRDFELDASGTHVKTTLCRSPSGILREITRYLGRRVEWLDPWGQPLHPTGATGLLRTFDAQGHVLRYEYLDAKGRPTENGDGIVEKRLRTNSNGEVIRRSFFDADGKPMLSKDGYHREDWEPDGFGGWLAVRYYDAAGKPTADVDGVHLVRAEENAAGAMMGKSYWGLDGKPVNGHDGYHAFKERRGDHGQVLEYDLYDVSGQLAPGAEGWAIEKLDYDQRGRPIEWAYFKADGSPGTGQDGYYKKLAELDADGHRLVQRFFGADDRPVLLKEGYATKQTVYDARGNRKAELFFGAENQPVKDETGVHRTEWRRNATDQVIAISHYDTDGTLVDSRDGWARATIAHGPGGAELRRDYFDASGAAVDVATYRVVSIRLGAENLDSARASLQRVLDKVGAGMDLEHAARAVGLRSWSFKSPPGTLVEAVKQVGPGVTSKVIRLTHTLEIVHRDK